MADNFNDSVGLEEVEPSLENYLEADETVNEVETFSDSKNINDVILEYPILKEYTLTEDEISYLEYSSIEKDLIREVISFIINKHETQKFKKYQVFFSVKVPDNYRESSINAFSKYMRDNSPAYEDANIINKNKYTIVRYPYEESKGMIRCKFEYCKSQNTTVMQRQDRSADEPMSSYLICFTCGRQRRL